MAVDRFKETLARFYPDGRLSDAEATEAFHNLAGFLGVLIRVNERERLVPTVVDAPDHTEGRRRARR
jgi:hypothetical protein